MTIATQKSARAQAQRNANYFHRPYMVFMDHLGHWRCETAAYGPQSIACEIYTPSEQRGWELNGR